jgi:hypothetical protein
VPSTHITDADIERFRRRQLPGDALVAFGDHLAGCGDCRNRLAERGDTAAAVVSLQEALVGGGDDHIPESEIHSFIDGGLDAETRAAVSAHLAHCPACADEVRHLREFVVALGRPTRSRSPWRYGALAAAAVVVLAVGVGLMWRSRSAPRVAAITGVDEAGTPDPADTARVRDALESGRLTLPPGLSELAGRQGALLGAADAPAFHLTTPIATVVLDDRPTLRWTALPGPATYIVTLQDQTTGDAISSPPLQQTEWVPAQPLERGRIYAWQVAGSAGGKESLAPRPPDPPIRFIVATASDAARLERLPSSPLVRGVLFANAGLLDDAERELKTIGADSSDAARAAAFLEQLRQARSLR